MTLLFALVTTSPAHGGREATHVAVNIQTSPKAQLRPYGSKAHRLPTMSRLRVGDQIVLDDDQTVTLVFEATGRIERWTGPGKVRLNTDQCTSDTGSVEVFASDASLGDAFAVLPILVRRATNERGSSMGLVTGMDGYEPVRLNEDERRQIAAAVKMSAKLRAELPDDIVVPELYRGILHVGFAQYAECVDAFSEAAKRCPECPHMAAFEAWCADR